ncbi:PD-(D/E)XK nuclease family protein [Holophaga foetida]|uniref:PD-(D/E)XK nuclease family protein n=1 Tax=Holophaga foetida TaxID=35839 RepID=UPI0002472119|nr:PD-(D/E)XK nuclease family protein [Holophaga foetida]
MSHAPFDGVLLDDARPSVSGALAMLLHLRVARRMAVELGWCWPSLDFVQGRAQACQELMAHGLLPEALRGLGDKGLCLGDLKAPHSLASLATHLEAYQAEVESAGCLEPDAALWRAVDRHLEGQRALWIERTEADGPILAGLKDLEPVRLRVLACVPGLSARFALATRWGDGSSGLFGSSQPLVAWLLDGLETHGQGFANDLQLSEPEGWGSAPWGQALEGLFEGPLALGTHAACFQRGLVDGPLELLRHGVEQVCRWLEEGIPPQDITVIHPEPQKLAPFLAPILAEEGVRLHVRGGLQPLIESAAWSPLWALLSGLLRLDPCGLAAGLRVSQRWELRAWAERLAQADQDGLPAFERSFIHLKESERVKAEGLWKELQVLRGSTLSAKAWADRLEDLAGTIRLPMDSEDFFAPLGLLKEAWGKEVWSFVEMLPALRAFLEAARSAQVPRAPEGLRLVGPGTLVDDWSGSRATLILDLSEGAWPGSPSSNPDLDWDRKGAINQALLEATRSEAPGPFPPALQRFWLPRSEHGDQIPRSFQRDAYAFNKVLAMTQEHLVALSPGQDASGRTRSQGPFWTALEGVAEWKADPTRAASRFRWLWEGGDPDPVADARAQVARPRSCEESLGARTRPEDRVAEAREAWLRGQSHVSPTALESLARCPFRSMAERVWRLGSSDPVGGLAMDVGTLAHHVLEEALKPYLHCKDWPASFREKAGGDADTLLVHLKGLWDLHGSDWLAGLENIKEEQRPQAILDLEALLPNLAAYLDLDAGAQDPTPQELALLFPADRPAKGGWRRTLLALEGELGPVALELDEGRSLVVKGRVDLLERWEHSEGSSFLRVVDYKTSREKRLEAHAEGDAPFASHLQTPLYMLLAEAQHKLPATAVLVPLREESPKPFVKHLNLLEASEDWRAHLRKNLTDFDQRLEVGDFPPTPGEACRYCELAALCGRPVDVVADEEGD